MSYSSHLYAAGEDLKSMIDLLAEVRPAGRIADFPSASDLREVLALRGVQENTRLWRDEKGRVVGFAYIDQYHNLWFEIYRRALFEIENEIVAWGEACIRKAMSAQGEDLTLDASCRDDDEERIELLERHGFMVQPVRSLQMVRPLADPILAPRIPAGFTIRPAAGEHKAGALVELHRAAFGSENMTVEERLSIMRGPDYHAELDLVAAASDGQFVAHCLCAIYREENEQTGRRDGHAEIVATHPDYRRRGLAGALLLAGLQKLRQQGMDRTCLGTSSENLAMQRAARAAGFKLQSTVLWFARAASRD